MRFWDNPEAPLVDVYWYPTELPFLPWPTIFNSRDWCEDPWHYTGRGEVFGAARPYNGMEVVAGLTGAHICGTRADFEDGPEWPPTGEPLVYDDDGIPTCCRRVPIFHVTSGSRPGATVSGPPYQFRTSSTSRPAAIISAIVNVNVLISTGSRGGSEVEYETVHYGNASSGSRPASGVSISALLNGNVASGSSLAALVRTEPPFLGNVTSVSSAEAPVGIATCPVLAPSCATAVPTMVNLECGFFTVAEFSLWRKWFLIPGKTYRFIIDFEPDSGGTWIMYGGDDCTGLTELFAGTEHPPHQEHDFVAPGVIAAWDLGVPTSEGMAGTTKIIRLD